jgi:hypothetical protein
VSTYESAQKGLAQRSVAHPWHAKIRQGWPLVWAWTVLNLPGTLLVIFTLPWRDHLHTLKIRLLIWTAFAIWAAGQAWLLRLIGGLVYFGYLRGYYSPALQSASMRA